MLPVPSVPFFVQCGKDSFEFVRPSDPESILDSMTDEEYEKDKFLPYWAEQWPASLPLFRFLAANFLSALSPGGLIAELGSGLGLASSLLAAKGLRVVASDIALDACKYSRHNILLHAPRARAVCMDWRRGCFKPVFDCIVASDILYEQRWISPVIGLLNGALKPGGVAYCADPCRQWWNEFQSRAHARGFGASLVWEEYVNQGKTKVEILRLTKSG
jgi:SAM-dependent methyltransferase